MLGGLNQLQLEDRPFTQLFLPCSYKQLPQHNAMPLRLEGSAGSLCFPHTRLPVVTLPDCAACLDDCLHARHARLNALVTCVCLLLLFWVLF